jgi:Tol biopolymer transport system component
MNIDGTGTRRVSRGDFYNFVPRWSPDGTRLGFTSSRNGSMGTQFGVTVVDVTEALWAWAKY